MKACRLIWFFLALTILGCTGATHLVVDNERATDMSMEITAYFERNKEAKNWSGKVPAGESSTTLSWPSRQPPTSIEVKLNNETITFAGSTLNTDLARGSSVGDAYHLILDSNKTHIESAGFWESLMLVPHIFLSFLLFVAFVLGLTIYFFRQAKLRDMISKSNTTITKR